MDTSPSTDLNLQVKLENRDSLFYDTYLWCIDFRLEDSSCLRQIDQNLDNYKSSISKRWNWRNSSRLSVNRGSMVNYGGSWHVRARKTQNSMTLDELLLIGEMLWQHRNQLQMVIFSGWVYLYTNDLALLEPLKELPQIDHVSIRKANVTHPKDTLLRLESTHKRRTYIRERLLTAQQKRSLKSLLLAQTEVRLAPSLIKWLENDSYLRSSPHFWFDHNDEGLGMMISMIEPKLIGKRKDIITINKS